jgi:hypothetical protein
VNFNAIVNEIEMVLGGVLGANIRIESVLIPR